LCEVRVLERVDAPPEYSSDNQPPRETARRLFCFVSARAA
jgi:hypothetical protein